MTSALKKESGVSFVELLIGIAVGSLLLMAVVMFFGRGIGIYREQFEQVLTVEEARIQMNRMSDTLRDARNSGGNDWLVLGEAEDYSIQFYSNTDADADVELIGYSVADTGVVTRTVDGVSLPVARGIRNRDAGTMEPFFTYYDASGNVITGSRDANNVRSIGITLVVDNNPGQLPGAITVTTRVTPRQKVSAASEILRPVEISLQPGGDAIVTVKDPDTNAVISQDTIAINDLNDGRVRVYENGYYTHISEMASVWYAWMGSIDDYDQMSIDDLHTYSCLDPSAGSLEALLATCNSGLGYDPVFMYTYGGLSDYIREITY